MKKLIAALAICGLFASFANAQDDWVGIGADGGAITITNNTGNVVPMLGLDVKSASGGLKANGSGPFAITLLDTPGNVVVGNLGSAFELGANATVATEIAYTGSGELATDLAGTTWGNGVTPTAVTFPTAGPVVPEPASGLLACFAALGFLGFRRRRS